MELGVETRTTWTCTGCKTCWDTAYLMGWNDGMKAVSSPREAVGQQLAQLACGAAPCNCWSEKDRKLREKGYKISDACAMLQIKDLKITAKFGLPLQRTDGAKLKPDDPRMILLSHCPFCGGGL